MEKITYLLIKDINNKFFKNYSGAGGEFYHPKYDDIALIKNDRWNNLIRQFIEDADYRGDIEKIVLEDNDTIDNKFWKYNGLYYKTPDAVCAAFKKDNFEILKYINLEPGTEQEYLNNWKKGKEE